MENRFLSAEKIKENTIKLATEVFATLKEFKKKYTRTDEEWHKLVIEKYPDFSKTHPTVVRCMTKENMYVESVFGKYLTQLEMIQGKGNIALIELQGDYVKELYIAHHKLQGKRYNMKLANTMRQNLIKHMTSFYNDAKKKEEEGKSEFAEKNDEYLQQKKKELLSFIQVHQDELSNALADINDGDSKMRELIEELGADTDSWSSLDIKLGDIPPEEQVVQLRRYETDLLWFVDKLNQIAEGLETQKHEAERIQRLKREEEYLKGTNLEYFQKKKQRALPRKQ